MANYLYKTALYETDAEVVGKDPDNDTWLTDYGNNYQSSTVKIDSLQVAETTFIVVVDYDVFKTYITGDYDWGDVKEVFDGNHYDLYLITTEVL